MPFPFDCNNLKPEVVSRHEALVKSVSTRITSFHNAQRPYRIYHGTTSSTRKSQYHKENIVDTSQLSHVLQIDKVAKTILVEPNVAMDQLVEATLVHGLLPPVVMELPGITVGGGFSGTSAESSSFKHGMFERTVQWIEIVIPDGTVVSASAKDRLDLFYGAGSSFGTLGVTTLLQCRLIEARAFVLLSYLPVFGFEHARQEIENALDEPKLDYLDGIMYSKQSGVICKGRLVEEVPKDVPMRRLSRARDPWFYLNAQRQLKNAPAISLEAVPITDYLFRYDRGAFWTGKYGFKWFGVPFNRVSRWAVNRFTHTRTMYHALHQTDFANEYIVQDVAVPLSSSDEFFEYVDAKFSHYPIWLCPLLVKGPPPLFHRSLIGTDSDNVDRRQNLCLGKGMLLNFGICGPGSNSRKECVAMNRDLEMTLDAFGGLKCLYAHAYYTHDEFWAIYDKSKYDALRTKYHATYLPTVFDKVMVDLVAEEQALAARSRTRRFKDRLWAIWPLEGLYAVAHTVLRKDYLMVDSKRSKST